MQLVLGFINSKLLPLLNASISAVHIRAVADRAHCFPAPINCGCLLGLRIVLITSGPFRAAQAYSVAEVAAGCVCAARWVLVCGWCSA
jgi:hypothetical protein